MEINYSLGVDFGTGAVRALVLNLLNGREEAWGVCAYPSGESGVLLDPENPLLARQNPADYISCLEEVVKKAVKKAEEKGIRAEQIVGIGVDATGSTPIPVDENLVPLGINEKFKDNLNAQAWLWKDHTAKKEAREITALAAKIRPEYLRKCGGSYSPEWFFSKIYKCLKDDPEVFQAAYTWMELSDFIPAMLAEIKDVKEVRRNVCAAGHKAMYGPAWGGLPDAEFLAQLDPKMAELRERLYADVCTFEETAGLLSKSWAQRFGLKEGLPIAVGILDAHAGAIGAGIEKGSMVKIIGTSTCDILVLSDEQEETEEITGVAGVVKGAVLPDSTSIEAGQPAVGDLLHWFIHTVLQKDSGYHQELTEKAQALQPGQTGLLALDWNNGNRNTLADPDLTGLLLGQTLNTKDFEIYRALIEATAFGAFKIIEHIESQHIKINKVIATGGIAKKNELFMQIYADVFNKEVSVPESEQTVALGAAIMGAVAALKGQPGYENTEAVQTRVCKATGTIYKPQKDANTIYRKLYSMYSKLYNAFGLPDQKTDLFSIMKDLSALKRR